LVKYSQSTLFDVMTKPESRLSCRPLQSSSHDSRSISWCPCKTVLNPSCRDDGRGASPWSILRYCIRGYCKSWG